MVLKLKKKEKEKKKTRAVKEASFLDMEEFIDISYKMLVKQRRQGIIFTPVPYGFKEVEVYPLNEPWAYARIVYNPVTGEYRYIVDEVKLTEEESLIYRAIVSLMIFELEPPTEGISDPLQYFRENARKIIRKYMLRLGPTPRVSWAKIQYFVERDILGFGVIDPLMRDPYVEDISCDGVGKPIYLWHRKYESIPTNIVFQDEEELDKFIVKLAHLAGKHISVAFPIVDAILPGGHRLAATYKREVTTSGSTFTIRKFREDPITIVDMLSFGNLSYLEAGYFWMLMEHKMSGMIIGVTGSGKTTTLNAIITLVKPTMKIVTIEDTPEIRLPLENWVQLVSRPSYGVGTEKAGEITLYDLVRVSLRYRPDYIIVGEVRGEEAYVLMQAIATGHGGVTTLHAEHIEQAVRRLTSPPMNIPESYIPLLNFMVVVKRINIEGKIVRRLTNIWEIIDINKYNPIGKWDPASDTHTINLEKSYLLKKIAEMHGKDIEWAIREVKRRGTVLLMLQLLGRRHYRELGKYVALYYSNPDKTYEEALKVIKSKAIDLEEYGLI